MLPSKHPPIETRVKRVPQSSIFEIMFCREAWRTPVWSLSLLLVVLVQVAAALWAFGWIGNQDHEHDNILLQSLIPDIRIVDNLNPVQ